MIHLRYVEALNETLPTKAQSIFLAGGIQGCPNWQEPMAKALIEGTMNLVVFNPRRADFPIDEPRAAEAQITWEHRHLRASSAVAFWFCKETQPIVLYELGAWSMTSKHIFVGVEPGYPREQDVRIQTKLVRPYVNVVSKLEDLVKQVADWTKS